MQVVGEQPQRITDAAGLASAPGFVRDAAAHYEQLRADHKRVAAVHARYASSQERYHTLRGGKIERFRPRSRLPDDYLDRRLFVALAFLWARAMRPPHAPASRKVGPLAWQFSAVAKEQP